jgi:hypothetical protein
MIIADQFKALLERSRQLYDVSDNERRSGGAELEDQDGHEKSLRLQACRLSSLHRVSRSSEAMLRLTHTRWKRTVYF